MTLAEHLHATGQSAYAFFTRNGLPKSTVYKVVNGKPVDYDTAERISAATGGVVSVMEIFRPGRSGK